MTHHRLVSLWDMLQLPIKDLAIQVRFLTSIWATMNHTSQLHPGQDVPLVLDNQTRDSLLVHLGGLRASCIALDFKVSASIAADALEFVKQAEPVPNMAKVVIRGRLHKWLFEALQNLIGNFTREGESTQAMVLTASELGLIAPSGTHFGVEVNDKFPKAAYEIDEAAKCLGFGRSTACVFHLMRALETSLTAVALCLGASRPTNPNWGLWLEAINKNRLSRSPTGSKKWDENDLFQDIYQRLDAVKDAQRNSTLHVERVYTEAEAKDIFAATRSFMQRVASRMDQDGRPLA